MTSYIPYQFRKGSDEIIIEIISGIIISIILSLLVGYLLQDYSFYYFGIISVVNIIGLYHLWDKYRHASLTYLVGWMSGLIILFGFFEIQFGAVELVIYLFLPLIVIMYKIYRENKRSIY